MATRPLVVVKSVTDALDILSKNVVPLNRDDFNPLGAYVYPLRSQVPVAVKLESVRNARHILLTREEGIITNLYLPIERQLFQMLEPKYGPLEHGGIERQLQAFYHPDQRYREHVLRFPFWVKTGEIGVRTKGGHEFYRITRTALRQAPEDYSYTLTESKIPIPPTGFFSRIGNTEGKGYWAGVVYEDAEGRSAVWCGWHPDMQGFLAYAGKPLGNDDDGIVDTWRKAT